ncbi:MAG: right-handed parallel beta-helix repeat-containing protein [Luteolibacter sp.]|jgi:hypothetical protein|nr:right-handed parallel beta-helix repeat-containing protein [Luteolibacter sp.]
MKNRISRIIWSATALSTAIGMAADFHVAPGGSDENPGTKEKPLATLHSARDAARAAGAGPHRIVVLPGEYFLAKTLDLDSRDNGLSIEADEAGKVILYGGKQVVGWQRDGANFWRAELPEVKAGTWDFRSLVVNGSLPERARMPETGTFTHLSKFDVQWLSSVGGGWARPPLPEELVTMLYDPKDLPASLDAGNAEVRVYHMWDESLVGIDRNDTDRHALVFRSPAISPPGAYGVKKYVVFNTREGMTKPGQWYLDRTAGQVVYWPLEGEDMTKAKVFAPVLERIIGIVGTSKAAAEKITLRGLSLQATTTPLKPGGFGAGRFDGAIRMERARQCVLDNLEISNVAGQGVMAREIVDCEIRDSAIHHAGACGIHASGGNVLVARNHLHHVGLYHPSAVALLASHELRAPDDKGFHIYRNEISDTPYSGIICGGGGHLIEENLISRVMREMHDGGAIYGGIRNSILRGNVVRDVVEVGSGYGVSAYYLDEGAEDCVVERNVAIGVERPVHNHIARNLVIRDNVFIAEKGMTLSFQRSGGCTFTGNTLFAPGGISIVSPNAIKVWEKNVIYRDGITQAGTARAFTIGDAMPLTPAPGRKNAPVSVARAAQAPVLDGVIGLDEWSVPLVSLDREPSRWNGSGAPVLSQFSYDDKCLYVAVNTVLFDGSKIRKGGVWGRDDGAEISIAGGDANFVLRGFADDTLQSVTDAGASSAAATGLGKAVRFVAKPYGKSKFGWHCEWAIPFEALGLKPVAGLKIAFNLGVYRAEDGVSRCLEGTLAENWRLDQAAVLELK